jgi:hypothetical protein
MHWVIQKSIFKSVNYQLLVGALDRVKIDYSVVSIPRNTYDLEPEIDINSRVYVCGAIKLKQIAEQRGWSPGSFLNENFRVDLWSRYLDDLMLNDIFMISKLSDVDAYQANKFFIRPLVDNKAFNGTVMDIETLQAWKNDPQKKYLMDLDVALSPVKNILYEYRLFVVKHKIITASQYMRATKPELSSFVSSTAIDFVNKVIERWTPSESFVIDIALTTQGYRVIEFNNINSSGFYACEVEKYVKAVQDNYG